MIKDIERLENESQARMTMHYSDGNHVNIVEEEVTQFIIAQWWKVSLMWAMLWCLIVLTAAVATGSWILWTAFAFNAALSYYAAYRVMRYRRDGYYGRTGTEAETS